MQFSSPRKLTPASTLVMSRTRIPSSGSVPSGRGIPVDKYRHCAVRSRPKVDRIGRRATVRNARETPIIVPAISLGISSDVELTAAAGSFNGCGDRSATARAPRKPHEAEVSSRHRTAHLSRKIRRRSDVSLNPILFRRHVYRSR